ncbi:MAG: hypothetical protein ACLFTT_08880 [Candidatus Hydrogenedentota bacterium]
MADRYATDDLEYFIDMLFDLLDLVNMLLDVLRNFGEFINGR